MSRVERVNRIVFVAWTLFCAGGWAAVPSEQPSAVASLVSFPVVPWADCRVVRDSKGLRIVARDGKKTVLSFSAKKGLDKLAVRLEPDAVVIDARSAFSDGAVAVNVTTPLFGFKDLLDDEGVFACTYSGPPDGMIRSCIEGQRANHAHYICQRFHKLTDEPLQNRFSELIPADLKSLRFLLQIVNPGKGEIRIHRLERGLVSDFPVSEAPEPKPEVLFRADFDGTTTASSAQGAVEPVESVDVRFVEGYRGSAVRLSPGSRLAYAIPKNLNVREGSVSLWVKFPAGSPATDTLFSLDGEPSAGNGAFAYGFLDGRFSCQRGDDRNETMSAFPTAEGKAVPDNGWHHVVFNWRDVPSSWVRLIYLDGRRLPSNHFAYTDAHAPLENLKREIGKLVFGGRTVPTVFRLCRGHRQDGAWQGLEATVDELEIWSCPLNQTEIRDLYEKKRLRKLDVDRRYVLAYTPTDVVLSLRKTSDGSVRRKTVRINRGPGLERLEFDGETTEVWVLGRGESLVAPPQKVAGVPGKRTLVDEWRAGTWESDPERFRSAGVCSPTLKELNGIRYLEAGDKRFCRFALRFNLPTNAIYCLEMDYPDDRLRTSDTILQPCCEGQFRQDYQMQVGVSSGEEYAPTGRMLSRRVIYWPRLADNALIVQTIADGAPAALAAVRVYRLDDGALPAAKIVEPQGADHRHFANYSEDCAVDSWFSRRQDTPENFTELIDRLVSYMKYTGEDLFAYPGAWYEGLIDKDGGLYSPRNHASRFLEAFYLKFGEAGLGVMPTINFMYLPVPRGGVTRQKLADGSLHATPVGILANGRPTWRGFHGAPPSYNISHETTRKAVFDIVDALIRQGRGYPSFRGICLHLTMATIPAWGSIDAGYNDYTVEMFEKATGIRVPVDRTDPKRGKAYAAWLKANAYEKWVDWRCDFLVDFYAEIAERLRRARPDLKLWLSCDTKSTLRPDAADICEPGVAMRRVKEMGIDAAKLQARIPNLYLDVVTWPAIWRDEYAGYTVSREAKLAAREILKSADYFRPLDAVSFPFVNIHDAYYEQAVGRQKGAGVLAGGWLPCEHPWRVSAQNGAGAHAMEQFALPFRHTDVLGFAKGGFLIGTHGMEDLLAPFMQNFRALPAVKFDTLAQADGVVLRGKKHGGKSYFYLVNTAFEPREVSVRFPERTSALVTAEMCGGRRKVKVPGYSILSFAAPSGMPQLLESAREIRGDRL